MKKHKVSYDALIFGKKLEIYKEENDYITGLIDEGEILPIKASGTNGKKPAMYRTFWVFEDEEDYAEYFNEIEYQLSSRINPEFYLKHPDIYVKERKYVLALSRYFDNNESDLGVKLSENERSYAIWKREKFLSGQSEMVDYGTVTAAAVLRHSGVDIQELNTYKTAEPMAFYSADRDTPQNILIVENLDPFYGIRYCLMQEKTTILGKYFSTVIYGGGKRVTSYFEGFEVFAEEYLKAYGNTFYYYGDLDYEGIIIYESFASKMSGCIEVVPFVEAYEKLVQDVGVDDISDLPISKEKQNKGIGTKFLEFFSRDISDKILSILESGRYIPQEKISLLNY